MDLIILIPAAAALLSGLAVYWATGGRGTEENKLLGRRNNRPPEAF